jgi:phosphoribosylaminoimidazole (AIR) synthetase
MGLGMVIAVPPEAAAGAVALLAGSQARIVGTIVPRAGGEPSRLTGAAARP